MDPEAGRFQGRQDDIAPLAIARQELVDRQRIQDNLFALGLLVADNSADDSAESGLHSFDAFEDADRRSLGFPLRGAVAALTTRPCRLALGG
jgi:hypothetical protein